MHEMSIAKSIVQIAESEAKKAGVTRFSAIDLEIGSLAGIELDALEFVWEPAVKGSVLEGAIKRVHLVSGQAKCEECQETFPLEFLHQPCPKCDSFKKTIIQGRELRVKCLETP